MRFSRRTLLSAAAAAAIAVASSAGAANAAGRAEPAAGAELWVSNYTNAEGSPGDSVAVSPDGGKVFVTGASTGHGLDYVTVGYNAATGAQLWASIYGSGYALAHQVAVSPDGSTVFVTGTSQASGSGLDYATVAYDATTGTQLWASHYNGPGNGKDVAYSLAVSPDGKSVFVSGGSHGLTRGYDYATVAYNAATGAQRWVRRYNAPAHRDDIAKAVAVSPDGRTLFVTGTSAGVTGQDYATIAYNAATGSRRWTRRYNGRANGADTASAIAVSPDGETVFVTGTSAGSTSGQDYATIAYNAATGARRWTRRYNGPKNRNDSASSVAVGPGGHIVFVTGSSGGRATAYATVAYDAATGARRWVRTVRFFRCSSHAAAVAANPGGHAVYVTGAGCYFSQITDTFVPDYFTISYAATTGVQRWANRYIAASNGDIASSLAVSPDGERVYVTGESNGITTIAYQG